MPQIYFDEQAAAGYDDSSWEMFAPALLDATVEFLADQAGDGPALEFGIGTGRVALPLSARGVSMHGIDISPHMIDRLKAKPGSGAIGVAIGDFANTRVEGSFTLVYLVFNTIMNLTSQDEQAACFQNAAAHLRPGGRFVVEVGVPDLRRLPPGEDKIAFAIDADYAGIDEYADLVDQIMYSHHYTIDGDRSEVFSMPFRYVWPSELDLMARLAGMSRVERWSDWDRQPFTGDSRSHVSVWQTSS